MAKRNGEGNKELQQSESGITSNTVFGVRWFGNAHVDLTFLIILRQSNRGKEKGRRQDIGSQKEEETGENHES